MEEGKPVVIEISENEDRGLSKILSFFGIFEFSRMQRKDQDPYFSY